VGDDAAGRRVGEITEAYAEVVRVPMAGVTSRKTRIRVAGQTLIRIDQGDGRVAEGPLPVRAEEVLGRAGAVLVSDYGRGVAAHPQIRRLLAGLPDGAPVVWDQRDLKGPDRPLVPAADRVRVLGALECVDAVAVFDELTPATLLERLRPNLWVKGDDYSGIDLAEAEVVRQHGGQVVLLPYLEGRSTTSLVARARSTADVSSGGGGR
jgi:rfaE bifunctional protein nucleotidyltransferase chain/domain